MAQCFCGCGESVPRFPLGLRSVNKRGALVRRDVEDFERHIETGLRSPRLEAHVADGRLLMAAIAESVHARQEPGDVVESESREFLRASREDFSLVAVGRAARESGMEPDEVMAAMARGEFDPFA